MTERKNNSNEQAADREFVMTPVGKVSTAVETTITATGPKRDGLKNPGVCSFKN